MSTDNLMNPFLEKGVNKKPGLRKMEAWTLHYGGEKYLAIDHQNNYVIVDGVEKACRFAISPDNDRLTTQILKTTENRAGFGRGRRMKFRWTRGNRLTAIDEVKD